MNNTENIIEIEHLSKHFGDDAFFHLRLINSDVHDLLSSLKTERGNTDPQKRRLLPPFLSFNSFIAQTAHTWEKRKHRRRPHQFPASE